MELRLEQRIRKWIEPVQYRFLIIPRAVRGQRKRLKTIQENKQARVVFIVSSLPMWRAQKVYELLRQDARFVIHMALYPFSTFEKAQQESAMRELRDYCREHDMPYIDLSGVSNPGAQLKKDLQPDIVFYPQPYNHLFENDLDCPFFADTLNCYLPYSFRTSSAPWAYRTYLNDTAWRLFYPTDAHRKEASQVLYNKGRNIRITGDPIIDVFSEPMKVDVWKPQDQKKKRVIWAPHFSIKNTGMLYRDSFTWLSKCMWEIAEKYQDKIQFVFKPHPRLLSELYSFDGWGKERADAYYAKWANGMNTQLVTGPYIDLFKGSDAMIHDSGSFSVEYHFTGKPVLFTTKDVNVSIAGQNELGREGILAHYLGASEADIIAFIEDTVLEGKDPRKADRAAFYEKYLRPPGGHTVAENIYREIVTGLGFE